MRRVPHLRQPSLPIRSTAFRQSGDPPSPLTDHPDGVRAVAKGPRAVRPQMPSSLAVRVTHDSIELTLPVPPSVNHQYATVNGRRLLSAKGRAYKNLVGQQILVALAHSPHRDTLRAMLRQANLALSINFFFVSALRRDTDGGLKIAQDALCEGLGLNDNRVVEIHLYRFQDRSNPRIDVRLSVSPHLSPEKAELGAPAPSVDIPTIHSAHQQRT